MSGRSVVKIPRPSLRFLRTSPALARWPRSHVFLLFQRQSSHPDVEKIRKVTLIAAETDRSAQSALNLLLAIWLLQFFSDPSYRFFGERLEEL